MSLRGVDNDSLDEFGREDDEQHQPPNNWEEESPAEAQELRWYNDESGETLWIESERSSGSPFAIFYSDGENVIADVIDQEYESVSEAEVEAVKIMEEIESEKE